MKSGLFFIILCIVSISLKANSLCQLNLVISGVDAGKGTLKLGLVDNEEQWGKPPSEDGMFLSYEKPASKETIALKLKDLPCGKPYAVQIYHDENNDGVFNTGLFGMPLEQYGFSNNVRSFFSKPNFQDALFILDASEKEMHIKIE